MKYEEPDMKVILLDENDIFTLTSSGNIDNGHYGKPFSYDGDKVEL